MTIIRIATIMLALFGIVTEDRAAIAQTYPSKPIKLVVPYAPGGPNDVIARILAQKLAEGLGGTFFVENTAGAGGTIATGQAANAATDGTTILVANQDLIVQPIIKTSGLFSQNGHAELWFSDDSRHILLQMKTKLAAAHRAAQRRFLCASTASLESAMIACTSSDTVVSGTSFFTGGMVRK